MTKEREALKLALEALDGLSEPYDVLKAQEAIREALAQPEQEPVAVKFPRHEKQSEDNWTIDPAFITRVKQSIDPETPWDFIPEMEQVETTLLALEVIPSNLYTTPPQRKPLTDEEIETYRYMIDWTASWSYINFARAIEAALKEKNT